MSRVGKSIIELPDKVEVSQVGNSLKIKGPLGELTSPIFDGIKMAVEGKTVSFSRNSEEKDIVAKHGLVRALFNNCVNGVSKGWEKNLEITGVGFRAQKRGKDLVLSLGYSHEVVFPEPKGITIEVKDQLKIRIFGTDRQMVGQVAADIRSKKPPEPYKGKGVKYSNEFIKRKAGKTGKK